MRFSRRVHLPLLVRVLVAFFTATVFQPDEYFQALEPAYRVVFGYGHLTWEWTSANPIRSILYPAVNIPIYWLLKETGLHDSGVLGDWLIIGGPRILHGLLAALTDISLCSLTRRVVGERYVDTALLLSLTSLFHALSLSRSLSNSLETSLATIAFAHYPWSIGPDFALDRSQLRRVLLFAALACAVRPTHAIIWVYLFGYLLWLLRTSFSSCIAVVQDAILIGVFSLGGLFVLDTWYYGQPTLTPLNFLLTNASNVSLFYGGNPWHFYVSQALPILCTTALPFVLHQAWRILAGHESRALNAMLGCITWTVGVYSLARHKEWRFIHPLLPLLHLFAAKSFNDIAAGKPAAFVRRMRIFLLLTLPASLYVVLLYCSGPIDVMAFLRSLPRADLESGGIGFLMPCHSTPGQAYLHRPELTNGKTWALGCEPPLQNENLSTYRDQTTVFFKSPHGYLTARFPSAVDPAFPPSAFPASVPGTRDAEAYAWRHAWPLHLVFFGALLEAEGVRDLLEQRGYRQVWAGGRWWEGDSDERKGGVRVWRYNIGNTSSPS
ncbi:Mannosyltransferase [Mycena kentingensis (nom. inval.)]|nr:Mannosyltransferase [Mycena kentingensis (nom. inval.)]